MFFKRYQIQPVWRGPSAKGRFLRVLSVISTPSDRLTGHRGGALAAVSDVLGRLRSILVIRLNHRRVLTALLEVAGIEAPQHADALVALDNSMIGPKAWKRNSGSRYCSDIGRLLDFAVSIPDASPIEMLDRLKGLVASHEAGMPRSDLASIVELAEVTKAGERIRIDPSLARGLSYYTGAIMEIAVPDLAGSLGGGGRYDNLVGMFLGRDVPACGFSLGLERIIVVMAERNMFPAKISLGAVDVMVAFLGDALRADAVKLASELRGEKLRVEIYPEGSRKLEKSLKYAAGRSVPVMAILGEDEQARGEVTVRDLQTRQQESVSRPSAAAAIARRVRLVEP